MSYFNDEQRDFMRYLATMPADTRCWSGWCSLTKTDSSGRRYCSSPSPCPIDVTLAERQRMACEVCGNFPDAVTMRFTHNAGCSRTLRVEFYESLDLGGEA